LRQNSRVNPPKRKAMLGATTPILPGHGEPDRLAAVVVVAGVWIVSVLLPDPIPGVTVAGLKVAVAPAGSPAAVSVTTLLKTSPAGVVATTML